MNMNHLSHAENISVNCFYQSVTVLTGTSPGRSSKTQTLYICQKCILILMAILPNSQLMSNILNFEKNTLSNLSANNQFNDSLVN